MASTSDRILARVVKPDFERKLGSWVTVSPRTFQKWGPSGSGHLARPRRPRPDVTNPEVIADPRYRGRATGAAKDLAQKLGIDLEGIQGSGKDATILVSDVRRLAEEGDGAGG